MTDQEPKPPRQCYVQRVFWDGEGLCYARLSTPKHREEYTRVVHREDWGELNRELADLKGKLERATAIILEAKDKSNDFIQQALAELGEKGGPG